MNKIMIPRRSFLQLSAGFSITAAVGSFLNGCTAPIDWSASQLTNNHVGFIKIISLDGEASANGVAIKPGAQLANYSNLLLHQGLMRVELPGQSVLELNHKANLQFDLDSRDGGIVNLKQGSLLSVIQKTIARPLIIKTAEAQFGIRGTVCFTQVLASEDKQNPQVPADASSYFCICNGKMDYLSRDSELVKTDQAEHHHSHFVVPEKQQLKLEAASFLLNHDDKQILDLVNAMPGKKHRTDWLFPKESEHGGGY